MFFRVLIFNFFVKLSGSYWTLFSIFSRESAILKTKISKTYNIQNYKKSPPARTRRSVGSQQFETRRAWLGRSGRTAGRRGQLAAAGPLGGGGRARAGLAAAGTQHSKQVGSGRAAGRLAGQRLERRRQLGWLAGLGGCLAAGPLGGGLVQGRRLAAGPPASARNAGDAGGDPRYGAAPRCVAPRG